MLLFLFCPLSLTALAKTMFADDYIHPPTHTQQLFFWQRKIHTKPSLKFEQLIRGDFRITDNAYKNNVGCKCSKK